METVNQSNAVFESIKELVYMSSRRTWEYKGRKVFDRFVSSGEIRMYLYTSRKIHANFDVIRLLCNDLLKDGKIDVLRRKGDQTHYSLPEFDGYEIEGATRFISMPDSETH